MTVDQLAKELGVHRTWIFTLKKKFPAECPNSYDDLSGWKTFLETTRHAKVKQARQIKPTPMDGGLSDIARLTKARASKVEHEDEILVIELDATRRQVVRQEEVIAMFGQIATVVRGRLMKMSNDLPSALLGLDAPAISKVVAEKLEYALQPFVIPDDFFSSKGFI